MKYLYNLIYKILVFTILMASLSSSVYASKRITFATLAPKTSTWGSLIVKIARDIYKKSNKQIIIKVFYGGVQGDESEMQEKIQFGQIDGGFFTGNGLGSVCYESRILEVPGLIKSYSELDHVYNNIVDDLNPYFEKNGFVLLDLLDVGYAYFFSKEPIDSLDAIRKTKMWIWKGDELVAKVMDRLEIPAVPVSFTEVIPSLQTGYIDGLYTTPTALVSLQWHKEIKYRMDLPITLVSSGIVLSKKTWDGFSPQEQKIIKDSLISLTRDHRKEIRTSDAATLQTLKEQNIVTIPYKNDRQFFYDKTVSLKKSFPDQLVKRVDKLLAEKR